MSNERPKKLQRISQACDFCHRRSIRCRPSQENAQLQCQNCFDFQVDCTYNRPSRRRRRHSISLASLPNQYPSQRSAVSPETTTFAFDVPCSTTDKRNGSIVTTEPLVPTVRNRNSSRPDNTDAAPSVAWRSFALASRDRIYRLLEIYMDVVYPIFPLFHGPTFWRKIENQDHLVDRGFFASVMAACALASARASLGATGKTAHSGIQGLERQVDIFSAAAEDVIPNPLAKALGLNYLRAYALLALTAVQCGQIKSMHQYLGHFMTLSAMQQFQDEAHWPSDITIYEREERRRLFWSMYKFDVSSAAVFGSTIRSREADACVDYPTEVNDEDLAPGLPSLAEEHNWLRGWNFTNDLCRVLEFIVERVRRSRRGSENRTHLPLLHTADNVGETQIMEHISNLCYQLPARFQDYNVCSTGDRETDIFGFQAANIQAALQLVRTTLFSTKWLPINDVSRKCSVAEQVLSAFHSISPPFLHAMSMPLVYQLSAIGTILASVMEGVLTEDSYSRVRKLLVSMADLLLGVELSLQATAGASKEIRQQIQRIDQYMEVQRQAITALQPSLEAALQGPAVSGAPALSHIPNPAFHNPFHSSGGPAITPDEFQLPPDLFGPWPFDFTQDVHQYFLAGSGIEA